jgi:hypothetical protein
MENIFEELGVPKKVPESNKQRGPLCCPGAQIMAEVSTTCQVKKNSNCVFRSLAKYSKLVEFIERGRFDSWPVSEEELGASWTKVFICVFLKKRDVKCYSFASHSNFNQG